MMNRQCRRARAWCNQSESSVIIHARKFLSYFTWPLPVTLLRVQGFSCFHIESMSYYLKVFSFKQYRAIMKRFVTTLSENSDDTTRLASGISSVGNPWQAATQIDIHIGFKWAGKELRYTHCHFKIHSKQATGKTGPNLEHKYDTGQGCIERLCVG